MMKLYNTLSRQVEELKPLNPPTVTVYTCGPTVYDYSHIGHWFNYVRMDMLIRTLKANNYQTKWVMNITDVGHLVSDADDGEDKLEKGARREGKTAWEVAQFYTEDFLNGLDQLNILRPDFIVKATDHIKEQQALIKTLEEKGYTYKISDGIYFETAKFADYAKFARLDLEEQNAGARVEVNQEKHSPNDFALWKFSPTDHQRDMEWDSPWGKGFPGWHIECSAMSMKYLGNTLDIHTGGIDHIPIHHTNEIAQSQAATDQPLANYWFHSNHVLIDDQKISKSLGNTIHISDIIEKGYSAEVLRFLILESNYRSQSKFSWESLEAAKTRLGDLYALAALIWQVDSNSTLTYDFQKVYTVVLDHLSNDINTPLVLAYLSGVVSDLSNQALNQTAANQLKQLLIKLDSLLGLKLSAIKDITDDQKQLIAKRSEARANKDWTTSDKLRDELKMQGIAISDEANGPIWRLV